MSLQQLSDGASEAKIKLLEWRMAICWFVLFSTVSLASALVSSLVNSRWDMMEAQDKILMTLTVFISWGTTMMAFFSKAAKKVEQQITPENSSSTEVTRTESVKVETTPPKTQ